VARNGYLPLSPVGEFLLRLRQHPFEPEK